MAQFNMFEEIIRTLSMGKQINQKVNVLEIYWYIDIDRIDYLKVKWSAIFPNIHAKVEVIEIATQENPWSGWKLNQYTFIF